MKESALETTQAKLDDEARAALAKFAGLGGASAEEIAGMMEEVRLSPGETLFGQGEPGDCAYLILSGTVELEISVPGQESHPLAILSAGMMLGELALFLEEPRIATGRTPNGARLWKLRRDRLTQVVEECTPWSGPFLLAVVRVLARRLTETDREIVALLQRLRENETLPKAVKAGELEQLRQRLFSQWSF